MYSKRYGNREEVFNGIARQTTGGLIKEDLLEKKIKGKTHYISLKMSNVMREKDNLSNFRQNRKTLRHNNKLLKNNKHNKTKKIKFTNNDKIKKYYYPELEGENLELIRSNYLEEEEDDFGKNENELNLDFDINSLDNDLNQVFNKI